MNSLIVFYSRTGNTKKLAEKIAEKLNCDSEEIIDKKNRNGAIAFVAAGRDAMKKSLTEINELKKNVSDYDLVLIATPCWAGKMTPAIRTFIEKNKCKFKKTALIQCSGSKEKQECIPEMIELIGKHLAELIVTAEEIKENKFEEKINEFCEELK
ncbi:MAG: NAD(P)H-dependent oxidoreductase [Candidatus Diapherotrites archaeon]|nr:NAD(P)H-dependent oxidoreductase [Candidatus Diapherotrites archaeon]